MKLSSDASVLRLTHEGITNFACLSYFDKKSIQCLTIICKNSTPDIDADVSNNIGAEGTIAGANTSSISVIRCVVAVISSKHYGSITRFITLHNVRYLILLTTFKTENASYLFVKYEAEPNVPKIYDSRNDHKAIRWFPIFKG